MGELSLTVEGEKIILFDKLGELSLSELCEKAGPGLKGFTSTRVDLGERLGLNVEAEFLGFQQLQEKEVV